VCIAPEEGEKGQWLWVGSRWWRHREGGGSSDLGRSVAGNGTGGGAFVRVVEGMEGEREGEGVAGV